MTSALSDDFADKLRQMYLEISRRTEKIERQLRSAYRPALREDFVLMQASTSNAIPAVTSSTTGIVPGTATDCKMLTINSSGDAVRCLEGRNFEVFNLGSEVAAGKPFWAHREFKSGRWVADGGPASAATSLIPSLAYYPGGWTYRAPSTGMIIPLENFINEGQWMDIVSSTGRIIPSRAGKFFVTMSARVQLFTSTTGEHTCRGAIALQRSDPATAVGEDMPDITVVISGVSATDGYVLHQVQNGFISVSTTNNLYIVATNTGSTSDTIFQIDRVYLTFHEDVS